MSPDASIDARLTAIFEAAEDSADEIRREAERRMRERIAEGDRAADNRIKAAAKLLEPTKSAREAAERCRPRDRSWSGVCAS